MNAPVKVWDTLFYKPEPVPSIQEWYASEEFNGSVYVPNCVLWPGHEGEDVHSNGAYSKCMVNAYRKMCQAEGISPFITTAKGLRLEVVRMRDSAYLQLDAVGGRVARLANSGLADDFDDSGYADKFIHHVCQLTPGEYVDEPTRQTVLSKAERLLGKGANHRTNHEIMRKVVTLVTEVYKADFSLLDQDGLSMKVLGTLHEMALDGFILEESEEEFVSRFRAYLPKDKLMLLKMIYAEGCSG